MLIGFILGIIIMFLIMTFINEQKKEKYKSERQTRRNRELQDRVLKKTGMTIEENLNFGDPGINEVITKERYIKQIKRVLYMYNQDLRNPDLSSNYENYRNIRNALEKYLDVLYNDNIKLPEKATFGEYNRLMEEYTKR